MSNRTWIPFLATLGLAGAAGLSAGCNAVECAEGTIEQNGACVPADEVVDEANCGEGTMLGPDGVCIPELPPTICEEGTTTEDTTTIPGVILCKGTGGGTCDSELTCPQADASKVSVCGRLYDVETDEQLRAAAPNVADCLSGGAADGPCEMKITFYDALEFAGNPSGATPIVPQDFLLDDCGRFRAHNLQRPSLGFLGIGVDDDDGSPDVHRLTGVAFPVVSAETRNRQKTYVVREATNQAWSDDAGLGTSFVDQGAFMTVFHGAGDVPVEGVQITEMGSVEAGNDYYFSDTDPNTRSTIDLTKNSTGVNGAGIKLNSALVEHSGTGGGCTWESALAASIPTVLFFSPRECQ